jgi:hypothetical protein
MLRFFIPVLAGALLTLAAPSSSANTVLQRASSATCGGLNGFGGFFDTAFNFTLLALNQTDNAARTQIIPAVVNQTDDADFSVLAVSIHCNDSTNRW